MTSHLSEAVAEKIGHAECLYHRLVIVAGADGSADAAALKAVAEYIDAPLINVSLELSRQLLDLTERQRRIRVPKGVAPELIIANECLHGEAARHCQGTTPVFDTIARAATTRDRIDGFGRASARSGWLARRAHPTAFRNA